jgi:hypothetical protein
VINATHQARYPTSPFPLWSRPRALLPPPPLPTSRLPQTVTVDCVSAPRLDPVVFLLRPNTHTIHCRTHTQGGVASTSYLFLFPRHRHSLPPPPRTFIGIQPCCRFPMCAHPSCSPLMGEPSCTCEENLERERGESLTHTHNTHNTTYTQSHTQHTQHTHWYTHTPTHTHIIPHTQHTHNTHSTHTTRTFVTHTHLCVCGVCACVRDLGHTYPGKVSTPRVW